MKKIRLVFFIIPLFLLFGCSIRTNIYVQNLTNQDKHLLIKYKISTIDLFGSQTLEIPYVDDFKTPKEFDKSKNPKFVETTKIDNYTIVLTIPKKSTTQIETTSNTRYYKYLESVELDGKTIFLEEFLAVSKRKGSHIIYKISED